jgi:ubiquitin-conjugating enzyme E2 A
MLNFATARLAKELIKINNEKIDGIIIDKPDDLMLWHAKIIGPIGTPYENGIFELILKFDSDYPNCPPSVKFITPMFHPNIYRDGKICVDILQSSEWSPVLNVRTILLSIMSLLMDPNPASPANRDAALLYLKDKNEYEETVRKFILDRIHH